MTPTSWAAFVRSFSGAAGPSLQPANAKASNPAAAPKSEKAEEDQGRGTDSDAYKQQAGSTILLRPTGLRDLKSAALRSSLVVHVMAFFAFVEELCRVQ
jgi:hypothetical protein